MLQPATPLLQRTPEWRNARVGFATASRMGDLMATLKSGGYGAGREKYRTEKIIERLSGESAESGFISRAMQDGIDREPRARAAYTLVTGNKVHQVGFITHPSIEWLGASPDGIVDGIIKPVGMIEIKCPEPPQHWRTVRDDEIDRAYRLQMQACMFCLGPQVQWCDFVSYHPAFETFDRDLKIIRVPRDERMIAEIMREVKLFLAEVEAEVAWARKVH